MYITSLAISFSYRVLGPLLHSQLIIIPCPVIGYIKQVIKFWLTHYTFITVDSFERVLIDIFQTRAVEPKIPMVAYSSNKE